MSKHRALGQLLWHRSIGLASSLFARVAGGERSLQDNRKQGLQPSASTGVLAVARVRERTMRALLCVVATAAALSGSARPPPRPPRGKSKGRSRAQRRGNVNVPSSVPEEPHHEPFRSQRAGGRAWGCTASASIHMASP